MHGFKRWENKKPSLIASIVISSLLTIVLLMIYILGYVGGLGDVSEAAEFVLLLWTLVLPYLVLCSWYVSARYYLNYLFDKVYVWDKRQIYINVIVLFIAGIGIVKGVIRLFELNIFPMEYFANPLYPVIARAVLLVVWVLWFLVGLWTTRRIIDEGEIKTHTVLALLLVAGVLVVATMYVNHDIDTKRESAEFSQMLDEIQV